MQISKTAYFTDGSSKVITFEKPSGWHQDAALCWVMAMDIAEQTGKLIDRICNTSCFRGRPVDINANTRSEIIDLRRNM